MVDVVHVVEKAVGLDAVLDHQAAQRRAVLVEKLLLEELGFGVVDLEQARDELAHLDVDLVEQPAGRGIERVVEIEHPGIDMAETRSYAGPRHARADAMRGEAVRAARECGTRPSRMMTPSTPDFDHGDAAFDLGDHAAGDGAVGDQLRHVAELQLADQLLVACRARPPRR